MAWNKYKGYIPDYPNYKSHGGDYGVRNRGCLWCQTLIVNPVNWGGEELSPFKGMSVEYADDTLTGLEDHVMNEHYLTAQWTVMPR